ncbi:MAG: hypothetical protein BWK79_07135 [Beggiatoa sp. IS2]|nr:MAG: hypothetical protein BWK79_07135 [Beggiatoa sp. IS2]
MKLQFSITPGCWERHLQRQYNNPLFSDQLRPITQREIESARHQDEKERQTFLRDFFVLLQEVSSLPAEVKAEVVLKLKRRIDGLYECCAGLGGNFTAEKQGLRNLSELIVQTILTSGVEQNPDVVAKLEAEIAEQKLHFTLLEYPFVAHLLHPYSPITEQDIVPALLSEEENSLRAAMSLFNLEQQQILCHTARNLLTRLQDEGHPVPTAWLRLAAMEQPLYRPH